MIVNWSKHQATAWYDIRILLTRSKLNISECSMLNPHSDHHQVNNRFLNSEKAFEILPRYGLNVIQQVFFQVNDGFKWEAEKFISVSISENAFSILISLDT